MADILSNMGSMKKHWAKFDAEIKKYEEERNKRRREMQIRYEKEKAKKQRQASQPPQNETTQTDRSPRRLTVSGTLRGYVPTMSDTLSGEALGELANKETLTPEEQQRVLKNEAARMAEARRAFEKRKWARERTAAGLDPTYPDRKGHW